MANALDCHIVHAEIVQVRRESAAESVPAVPGGKGIVALEYVAFGFVFFLRLPADRAAKELAWRAKSKEKRAEGTKTRDSSRCKNKEDQIEVSATAPNSWPTTKRECTAHRESSPLVGRHRWLSLRWYSSTLARSGSYTRRALQYSCRIRKPYR